jgi:hypothetical protein
MDDLHALPSRPDQLVTYGLHRQQVSRKTGSFYIFLRARPACADLQAGSGLVKGKVEAEVKAQ